MGTILALLGLILGAWAVRSICLKQQSSGKKVGKSIFAGWYFLTAGGMGATEEDKILVAIVMMLVGVAVVLYSNRAYKAPKNSNDEILREHAAALKDFDLTQNKDERDTYRTENFAKGKDASGLTKVAFYYVNGSGESSFRDVDVKKFDGHYIEGYCHLSSKFKTFRIDRVEGDVILRDTGEAMDAYHWAAEMEVI